MALRDKLKERAQPMLEPGEEVQAIFLAQTGPNPNLLFITSLISFISKYKLVAATDRAIVVMSAGLWKRTFPKQVEQRLPRETQLGLVDN